MVLELDQITFLFLHLGSLVLEFWTCFIIFIFLVILHVIVTPPFNFFRNGGIAPASASHRRLMEVLGPPRTSHVQKNRTDLEVCYNNHGEMVILLARVARGLWTSGAEAESWAHFTRNTPEAN
jgi:hypothetical protein